MKEINSNETFEISSPEIKGYKENKPENQTSHEDTKT